MGVILTTHLSLMEALRVTRTQTKKVGDCVDSSNDQQKNLSAHKWTGVFH